jgi:hypothetical protein
MPFLHHLNELYLSENNYCTTLFNKMVLRPLWESSSVWSASLSNSICILPLMISVSPYTGCLPIFEAT